VVKNFGLKLKAKARSKATRMQNNEVIISSSAKNVTHDNLHNHIHIFVYSYMQVKKSCTSMLMMNAQYEENNMNTVV